jgi:ABC-type transporter Mla subunit MlaD
MRTRLIALSVALLAAGVVVVLGTGAGNDHQGDYRVRAIFGNAFTVIPGEDVKISGVKVGKISALDVTPDNKAAIVLDITEPGFKDFRKDATCTIRPQSLIGERFVECTPTQPRAEGDPPAPALQKIDQGPGTGQYLLPDSQTAKPIDLDLVNNIMRLPYRQRLSIIVNELGTGLAANGDALRSAIREADPALQQTDRVLAILADQNRTLADLAKNGDAVLRPLARDKAKVADFIVQADTTAQASAQRRSDIEASLQKFPGFLKELKPTMQRLGALSDQMTPVLTDLNAAAPEINNFIKQLGPFSQAGTPALTSLGDAAVVGDQALLKSKPIATDLGAFAKEAKPTVNNLEALLTSLKQSGGIERLMDFLYFQAAATNGYDSLGHYLRAIFVLTTCTTYSTTPTPNCGANFPKNASGTAAAARAAKTLTAKPSVASANREIANGRSPYLARQDAVVNGVDPAAFAQSGGSSSSSSSSKGGTATTARQPSSAGTSTAPSSAPSSATPAATPAPSAPSAGATQTLLDYLLGG